MNTSYFSYSLIVTLFLSTHLMHAMELPKSANTAKSNQIRLIREDLNNIKQRITKECSVDHQQTLLNICNIHDATAESALLELSFQNPDDLSEIDNFIISYSTIYAPSLQKIIDLVIKETNSLENVTTTMSHVSI